MKNPITTEAREAAQHVGSRRRARRGLVAGYIHELSARHARDAQPQRERPSVYSRTIAEPEATARV
jgi:hypothetical protein